MLLDIIEQIKSSFTSQNVTYAVSALLWVVTFGSLVALRSSNAYRTRSKLNNLRRLGLSKSNMDDQHDAKYASSEGTKADGPVRIKAIFIHPVKSCGPVELDRAVLTKSGFLYDRCFAWATNTGPGGSNDDPDLQFISQRTKPKMSLIKSELWLPHKSSDPKDPLVQAGGCILLKFPDPDPATWVQKLQSFLEEKSFSATPYHSFLIPINPSSADMEKFKLQTKPFVIHSRTASGINMTSVPSISDSIPKLKKFLGYSDKHTLALFKCTPENLTRTDKNLAPLANIGSPAVHGYTDQQPVNINSLSSVQALSDLLPEENRPLNALRFRANLWITGASAYDEEAWKRCRITHTGSGGSQLSNLAVTLSVVCRTSRCTMTNVDPGQGSFSSETPPEGKKIGKPQPTTTLVEHRTVEEGNRAALGYIGMHAVPEDLDLNMAREKGEQLYVQVGDEIEVLERGVHLYGSTGNDY